MKGVLDFRRADFEGLKRYLQVVDWHWTDRESQVRVRVKGEE